MTTKSEIAAQLTAMEVEFDDKAKKADLEALLAANTPEGEGTEEETPKVSSSKVPLKYKLRYGKSQNCGDEMAGVFDDAVKGEKGKIDMGALRTIGSQNGIDVEKRWGEGRKDGKLNEGMQRMNLGNVLRSRVKGGKSVTIGEHTWNEDAEADEAAA